MGKNKNKGKKDTSVFKVAGVKAMKAKNKPKAVTTNLKKVCHVSFLFMTVKCALSQH